MISLIVFVIGLMIGLNFARVLNLVVLSKNKIKREAAKVESKVISELNK